MCANRVRRADSSIGNVGSATTYLPCDNRTHQRDALRDNDQEGLATQLDA